MRHHLITGFAAIGLAIAAASSEAVAGGRDEVIQKWVDAADSCLKGQGVWVSETSSDRGCYVVDGPQIYCDSKLPGGKNPKEVADQCFSEAGATVRPKRFGQK